MSAKRCCECIFFFTKAKTGTETRTRTGGEQKTTDYRAVSGREDVDEARPGTGIIIRLPTVSFFLVSLYFWVGKLINAGRNASIGQFGDWSAILFYSFVDLVLMRDGVLYILLLG